jgi:hypothetical protein
MALQLLKEIIYIISILPILIIIYFKSLFN